MKTLSKISFVFLFAVLISSFKTNPGGEGFEVYLDNKVVLQQFGNDLAKVSTLEVTRESINSKMTVKYWHCGKIGKSRSITIKDMDDHTLKVYRYPDTNSRISAMEIPVRDMFSNNKSSTLKIYYTSSELPKGRELVHLTTTKGSLAVK